MVPDLFRNPPKVVSRNWQTSAGTTDEEDSGKEEEFALNARFKKLKNPNRKTYGARNAKKIVSKVTHPTVDATHKTTMSDLSGITHTNGKENSETDME